MFEATVQINTVDEYNLFALFMSNLVEMRKPQVVTREEITTAIDAQYGKPEAPTKDAAVVGDIPSKLAERADEITDTKLIEAFTKYAPGKKADALAALLAKYGAKRVAEIEQSRRADFLAEISG